MRKKIIPFILITLVTLTSTACAFSDIEDHWAKDNIEKLNKTLVVKGYEDNTFRPDNYMTRAELVTIINRMNGVTKESSKYIPDITRQDWYYSEIRKAVQSGIMYGDQNGYMNPNSLVTREEAIVMLSRAFSIENTLSSANNIFKDEQSISNWAKDALDTFIINGYITGYSDGTIKPKGNITRAEFVTILNRIFAEIATSGIYTNIISGNVIVIGKNVVLNNLVVNGDLILAEGIKETLIIKNVEVKGNLILRENIDTSKILYAQKKINLYEDDVEILNKYINLDYGIEFSIPKSVKVYQKWENDITNYKKENIIIIEINQSEDNYYKNLDTIAKNEIKKVDNIYDIKEKGKINTIEYILYSDITQNSESFLLILKRDSTVYTLLFNKITINNLVDNVLGTLNFFETEKVSDRKNIIYKNSKLNLKFSYREGYIGIDDSYNTNNIYTGDAPIKLFIQVNTITDMNEYSLDEIIYLLKSLTKEDGEISETKKLKVFNKDAVQFKVISEDKLLYTLYVIDKNVLYKFIFMSDKNIMNEIGKELFNEIIYSLEF